MDALERLAETRIEQALADGAFERVPGRGRPLALEDLSGVPAELRGAYLLLKGSGVLPEELELRRERLRLDDLIPACADRDARAELERRRAAAILRYDLLLERRGGRAPAAEYALPLERRLGGRSAP